MRRCEAHVIALNNMRVYLRVYSRRLTKISRTGTRTQR